MKPAPFRYRRPDSLAGVLGELADAEPDVAVLAGGQSLVRLMNVRAVRPAVVVDINRVPGLDDITLTADAVRVGATVRVARLEREPALRDRLPVLSEAAALVGHPQIRSRATIGGSLCHADPAAELPTLAVTLDARLRLRSAAGERVVPATSFYRSPWTTDRRPGELLTEIEIPAPPGLLARFVEISRRTNDLPLVGVCVAILVDEGVVASARVGAGGVGPTPVRLPAAERALTGRALTELAGPASSRRPDESPLYRALAAAADETDPPDDAVGTAAFRRALLRSALRRAATGVAAVEAR
ncbi:xanthine dehydrogenase family protein subunit M [Micromonospora sp. WMMD712]|uniref:FAD binding domain-containing protein n=1 Tax=Micromonospora sp. WMMD712 TaxID=3016096 RepID=UPI002499DE3A|nr:xanthine dehydrogenase family protein subunit M [Micromonospora sp. WMMD712]WFE60214.1 xanthine dehydrogenase family protein subunit M [Micromonospora sp. WMMD712]